MKHIFSFRLKTTLGIIFIEALFLFLIGYYSLNILNESKLQDLEDYAEATSTLFASMARNAVMSNDLASLEIFVIKTMSNPKVRYVRVSSPRGVLAQAGDPAAIRRPFLMDGRFESIDDGTYDTLKIIKEGGAVYGYVQIGLIADQIPEIIAATRDRLIILSALLMALTAVFSMGLGFFLTRQLDALMVGADRVARGDLGYQVPVVGGDEMAHAAAMFNRMSTKLATTVTDLNRSLETSLRAERELREKEARLRAVLDGVVDAVVSIDEKGQVESFNTGAERIFGHAADEIIGRSVGLLMPAPHRSDHDAYIRRYLATGTSRQLGTIRETVGQRRDGTTFPIELSVSQVQLSDRILFTGIVRDISERKKNEEELLRYRERLELMVAERTRELQEAQAELVSRAMESGRAQWSAMVLHNIGNAVTPAMVQIDAISPRQLRSAVGYLRDGSRELENHRAELARFVNDTPRGSQVFDYLMTLPDALDRMCQKQSDAMAVVKHALGYVSEILTLQQSYTAREAEVREACDLNQIISDALLMQSAALEKRGIDVVRELSKEPPRLVIDKNRLLQTLVNFIKNAYEAIDQTDAAAERRITVSTFSDESTVGLTITDSGVGIPAGQLETLFNFGTSHKGSSGIGLYYCKLFVEANRGTLSITSAGPGRGASVDVVFSRQAGPPAAGQGDGRSLEQPMERTTADNGKQSHSGGG